MGWPVCKYVHNILALLIYSNYFLYTWYRKRGNILAIVTGIGLATYFWLPALVESRFMVEFKPCFPMLIIFRIFFQLLFPSWGTGFSGVGITADEMSYRLASCRYLYYVSSFFMALRKKALRAIIFPVLCVSVIAIIGMIEFSMPFWRYVPLMGNIQYPWRLWMVTTIAAGYLGALLTTVTPRWIMVGLTILAFIASFSPYEFSDV